LLPLFQNLGPILQTVLSMFMTGDWSGGLAVLKFQLSNLAPLFQTAAGSLQQGIPSIFGILMQYLGSIGTKVIAWIAEALPPILIALGGWALALVGWIAPMIPPMLESLGGVIAQLLTAVGQALPGIVAALAPYVAAFVEWIIVAGPPMLLMLAGLILKVLGWVAQQVPGIAKQIGEWALQFLGWIAPLIPKLLVSLGGLLAGLMGWIIANAPAILEKLGEWAKQFGIWARDKALPALLDALGKMFGGLWTELQRLWGAAFADGSIGKSLVDGLKQGIKDNWNGFTNWLVTQLHKVPLLGSLLDVLGVPAEPEGTGGTGTGGTGVGPGLDGHRAKGGDVRRGGRYLVGEDGPEIFEPDQNGEIHPNSVYRAITDPLAGIGSAFQGAAPTSRPPAIAGQASTWAAGSGGPVAGQGVQVNLTFQNPVVDSAERAEHFKREVLTEATSQFTVAIRRVLLAEG
ncbi:MAG: hypothetical protein HGA45_44100, partial [Chloroflexales bacterium]|nr:hypothetical protein [Chloroflexales bacterium]